MINIAFANRKGGVGKTTLTRELGIYLSFNGRSVLFVDLDPQGNLTKSLPVKNLDNAAVYDVMEDVEVKPVKVFDRAELYLLSSDVRLSNLEKTLVGELDGCVRLREALEKKEFSGFDYILIDSPPSLGMLSVNALSACGYFVIPMNPAQYTLQGTNDLMTTVKKIRKNFNPSLELLGVIINSFERVPVITREIREEIEESFGGMVFKEVLSRSVKVEEAISAKLGLVQLGESRVRSELERIGEEFILRAERGRL